MTEFFTPISELKGVGAKRAQAYGRLGIDTVGALLHHIPRRYYDLRHPVRIGQALTEDEQYVISCTVLKKLPVQYIRSNFVRYRAAATDGESEFLIVLYNNRYGFEALREGASYLLLGKVTGSALRREMHAPLIRKPEQARLEPVYPLTQGLSSVMLQTNITAALQQIQKDYDPLPAGLRRHYGLCGLYEALQSVHFPDSESALAEARRRLAFEELLQLQLGLSMLRGKSRAQASLRMHPVPMEPFLESLPFPLSESQKTAVSEIAAELCGETPMNRLLQGDVGSGKTAVAAAACYLCAKNGVQAALMAPTEILAVQHAHTLRQFLEPLGIPVALLTGSLPAAEKRQVLRQLQSGEAAVAVGTHAMFQKSVSFGALGLVITDEQHRFGVEQRRSLAEKGGTPHKLVMSATPIPRTLALMIYGDLDISVLETLPGRLPVRTYAVTGGMRQRIYAFVKKELDAGHQAYAVCPAISDSETLQTAERYARTLQEVFPEHRVGLLHGRLSAKDKEAVMAEFSAGAVSLLVSTTVVEVGVDVPNATVMLIENADRFGLSQLHQLRGRVGRSAVQSYCILLTDHATEEVRQRLRIMSSTSDGFQIAEEDLRRRGPGDFFGERQHGLPPLQLADLTDLVLLRETKEAADGILEADPTLSRPELTPLKLEVLRMFCQIGENGLN